jgi:hypothetical protein
MQEIHFCTIKYIEVEMHRDGAEAAAAHLQKKTAFAKFDNQTLNKLQTKIDKEGSVRVDYRAFAEYLGKPEEELYGFQTFSVTATHDNCDDCETEIRINCHCPQVEITRICTM